MKKLSVTIKFISVFAIAFVVGLLGMLSILGDDVTVSILYSGVFYIIGSGIIGVILYREWYFSLLPNWGSFLLGIGLLFSRGEKEIMFWILTLYNLFGLPLISLISGFIASKAVHKFWGHRDTNNNKKNN